MKPFWKSKTIWLNLITITLAVLGAPEVLGIIPASAMIYVPAVIVVLNILLRVFWTDTKIGKPK